MTSKTILDAVTEILYTPPLDKGGIWDPEVIVDRLAERDLLNRNNKNWREEVYFNLISITVLQKGTHLLNAKNIANVLNSKNLLAHTKD